MVISKDDKFILKKIILLMKPYSKKIILVLLVIIISSAASLILPVLTKRLVDDGLIMKNINEVIKLSFFGLVLIVIQKGIELVETKYSVLIHSLFLYDLSKRALKQLMGLRSQYFVSTNFSETINNIDVDINNIAKVMDKNSFFIFTSIFKIVGGLVGLMIIDWRLSIFVIVSIPVRIILVNYIYNKRRKIYGDYLEINRNYSSWYGETILGILEIKLFGLQRLKIGQFIKNQRYLIKNNIGIQTLDKLYEISEDMLFSVITYFIYIFGTILMINDDLSIGSIFAFITYCTFVTAHISVFFGITYSFSSILPSAKRFFGFLDMESETSAEIEKAKEKVETLKSGIVFENVSFSYDGSQQILKNISFEINKGEKVAILGPNGSGKTTILNLLLRLYEPVKGRILLDGTDIQTLRLLNYRRLISSVGQDLYIFNESIADNISLFLRTDNEKIKHAALLSGVSDFIERLPEGYESVVGRNGAMLSAGQRQKLAVARALCVKSEILVFDEATSNYDSGSEMKLCTRLNCDLKEKTIVIVSHKPALLKSVDRIILIDKGEIVGSGSHSELYIHNQFYTDLFDRCMQKDTSRIA